MSAQSFLTPAAGTVPPPRPGPGERLGSLDALRGFTMFWLVGGKTFIIALAGLGTGPVSETLKYQLTHTPWVGLRYYDLIWPCFMLMAGVSIPFSFARERKMAKVWRRAVALFLLGSLRESISSGTPRLIEMSSALQPIAVAYVFAAYLATRSLKAQIGAAALILTGYALLLAFVSAPGVSAGSYEMNHNLVTAVDQAIIGRAHPDGWGTALSTIPTIATTIAGLLFGRLLLSGRSPVYCIKVIAATGSGCLLAGLALSPVVPVIMKLWTTSYGLMSTGWACLLFLFFFWIVDVLGHRRWVFPLIVIGVNALAAYIGPTLVQTHRITGVFTKPVAQHLGALGPVLTSGAVLLVNWLALLWLYRRNISLRP